MAMTIRTLQARDQVRWCELFQQYNVFCKGEVPASVIATTWQRLLHGSDHMSGIVAADSTDTIAGLATMVFHRSTWSPTFYCYLEDLFVDTRYRGMGIGQALIEGVYAEADARGATRTYWAVDKENSAAMALYDRVATLSPYLQYRR